MADPDKGGSFPLFEETRDPRKKKGIAFREDRFTAGRELPRHGREFFQISFEERIQE